MKKTSILLMVLLAVCGLLLVSCSKDEKPNGDSSAPPTFETVDESSAISLKDYTMIRSDSSSKEVTSAAVELRMAIQKQCGYLLNLKTDFGGGGSLEIVIGKTKRGGADDLNGAEYVIRHTEKGFLIAGGSDSATVAAIKFFGDNLLSASGALCAENFEYRVDNSVKIGAKTYDEIKIFVGFRGDTCSNAIVSTLQAMGVPASTCEKESEANIVLTDDPDAKIAAVPLNSWGVAEMGGILYVVGRNEYEIKAACDYTAGYFTSNTGRFSFNEGVLKVDKIGSKEDFYAQKNLTIYPEFPERIRRDYMYSVSVTQGDKTATLPVYNHCQSEPAYYRDNVGGDNYRRFSIFAFSGEQVRVDVKVGCDFESYCVMPSAKGLKSEFKDGVISVYLDKPEYFMIRLDNDTNTILSILADYPEYPLDVPSKDDPKVTWISGVVEPKEGFMILSEEGSTLYIEPGAVLFSRVKLEGDNCKILGRGAMVDPFGNYYKLNTTGQTESKGVKFAQLAGNNCLFDGPVMLDGHCYNFNVSENCTVRNGKALSVMLTSDGLQLSSGSTAERCFVHVGDNGMVIQGEDIQFKDITVGTTCGAIFPQGGTKNIKMENIYVFRADGGLINNRYNGSNPRDREHTVSINGLYADDCTSLPWFFQGRDMGRLAKVFDITNATTCSSRGVESIYGTHNGGLILLETTEGTLFTDNYTLNFKNFYVDGKLVTSADDVNIKVSALNQNPKNTITFEHDDTKLPTRKDFSVKYSNSVNVCIGSLQVFLKDPAISEGGKIYLPAEEIQALLRASGSPKTVDKNGIKYAEANDLVAAGVAKSVDIKGNYVIFTPVYNGENLLLADVGDIPACVEAVAYKVDMTAEVIDGETVYHLFNVAKDGAGLVRGIIDEVKMYGNGKYVLEFDISGNGNISARYYLATPTDTANLSQKAFPIGAGWTNVKIEVDVNFANSDFVAFAFKIVAANDGVKSFDVKNITFKKIG